MPTVTPYLVFTGQCAEALAFYEQALEAKVTFKTTYGENQPDCPPVMKDRIMNANLTGDGFQIMACDGHDPNQTSVAGGNVCLVLDYTDKELETRVFNRLAEGGNVMMPLQDTFWKAHFGMVQDKYGFMWFLSSPVE